MHFFKFKGRQYLNMSGDLLLTKGDHPITTKTQGAGPTRVYNMSAGHVRGGFFARLHATFRALAFIWSR